MHIKQAYIFTINKSMHFKIWLFKWMQIVNNILWHDFLSAESIPVSFTFMYHVKFISRFIDLEMLNPFLFLLLDISLHYVTMRKKVSVVTSIATLYQDKLWKLYFVRWTQENIYIVLMSWIWSNVWLWCRSDM